MAFCSRQSYRDIAPLGSEIRPKGWKKRLRTIRPGLAEVNQTPRQLWHWAMGQARIIPVAYAPPAP